MSDFFGKPITRRGFAGITSAEFIGFNQAGTGTKAGTPEERKEGFVNVRDFGARGNATGVPGYGSDDTTAIHSAIGYAKSIGASVFFPPGCYRVTFGYTQNVIRQNVALIGPTRTADDTNLNIGAIILLDNADPARFFYAATNSHHLFVSNLRFRAAQYVRDSDFFRFSASSVNHRFHSVAFERIDRPIVYKAGCYFQMASFIDVQFNDAGTIFSDSIATSIGNLLTLVNVSHDGTVPANTAKIVCNLQGIRGIQGMNFLLEGALPATGWTVLKLNNDYSPDWTQDSIITINGFWSEWTVNSPTYVVEQVGGKATFAQATFNLSSTTRNKLTEGAQITIRDSSFIGNVAADTVNAMFSFEDTKCNAVLDRCTARYIDKTDERITFLNCSFSASGTVPYVTSAVFDSSQSTLVSRWLGGFVDGDNLSLTLGRSTTATPSADVTYGRKMVIIPNENVLLADFYVKPRDVFVIGTQLNIVALVKLPIFSRGTFIVTPIEQNSATAGGSSYDSSFSGSVIKVNISFRSSGITKTGMGLRIASMAVNVSGVVEVYSLAFYMGNSLPRFEYPNYPKQIETYNTIAPLRGTWVVGDRVKNTAPALGQPKGWICTVAGTPGTWVSEGSL